MKPVLYRLGVPLAALAGAVAAFWSVFVLGLAVPGLVVLPLTLGGVALFAGLGAAWAGNFAAPDHTRSRLPAVLLSSLASMILAAIACLAASLTLAATGTDVGTFGVLVLYGITGAVLIGGTSLWQPSVSGDREAGWGFTEQPRFCCPVFGQ